MTARTKPFQVLMLTDREEFGFNEQTLPLLVALMESASPDDINWLFSGVTGYFIASGISLGRIEKAIEAAERLRDSDSRFSMLGIGLAEGELLAEFDLLGRIKKSSLRPLGGAVTDANRSARDPQDYREKLKALKNREASQNV